jgi:hypothetical protein
LKEDPLNEKENEDFNETMIFDNSVHQVQTNLVSEADESS